MYCIKKITDDITWVGGSDRRLSMFEGVYSVPHGVSYNSYLIKDEKTVLIDTVDRAIEKVFFENVEKVLDGRTLDYVIVQHMEPDHSATLCELLLRYPEAVVVCSAKAQAMINQFYKGCALNIRVVAEGDTLETGNHTLRFFAAPMVHWPEVIVTYDEKKNILFSADAFGTFGALNGAIFADEVDFNHDYMDEARRYYTNIVGKYGPQVQSLLKKVSALKVNMICPLHGYVWRKNLPVYIDKYKKWSSYTPEETGVAVVYASIYGNTANAAEIIACRLADAGVKTAVFDVSVASASEIVAAAFRYSHIVFAAPTYNAGIFVTMEEVLRDIAAHNLQNRTVAIVQNGSWAPSSGKLMREIIESCKNMTIFEETLDIRSALDEAGLEKIDKLVDAIVKTIPGKADYESAIDPTALFKLSYGLFVLSARDGGRDSGCIINTAQQFTNTPNRITVSVNKQNFTHDMIINTGVFNVSVLSESATFDIFKHFGFSSGRDCEKFGDDVEFGRSANGVVYTTKSTNAYISGKVVETVDYGTHTLFIADVTETKILSNEPSVTYAYYFAHIKPKPQPKAPAPAKVWVCTLCGYTYDEAKEGVPFDKLPDDWTCPLCGSPKSAFELQAPAGSQDKPAAAGSSAADKPAAEKPAAEKPSDKEKPAGRVWVCRICGYVYDEAVEGVPFDQLPADWTCPLCKHPKSDFELQ